MKGVIRKLTRALEERPRGQVGIRNRHSGQRQCHDSAKPHSIDDDPGLPDLTCPLLYEIPDVRLGFGQNGGGGSTTLQILLSGEDGAALATAALALEKQMRALPELTNVHQITPRPGSELVVRLKPTEAARLGVTPESVASLVRVATIGDVDANSAKLNSGEQRLTVRVRLPGGVRSDLGALSTLRVPTISGATVPPGGSSRTIFSSRNIPH